MLTVPRASEGGNYAGVDTRDCEELGVRTGDQEIFESSIINEHFNNLQQCNKH